MTYAYTIDPREYNSLPPLVALCKSLHEETMFELADTDTINFVKELISLFQTVYPGKYTITPITTGGSMIPLKIAFSSTMERNHLILKWSSQ